MVRQIVQALPAALVTLAHAGPKSYSEAFDLVHRREASRANAIWQADHAQLLLGSCVVWICFYHFFQSVAGVLEISLPLLEQR